MKHLVSVFLFLNFNVSLCAQDSLSILKSFPRSGMFFKLDRSLVNHGQNLYSDEELIFGPDSNSTNIVEVVASRIVEYPMSAIVANLEGVVVIGFTVLEDGGTSNVRVVKHVNSALDSAAVKLMRGTPNWKRTFHEGKPVKVYYEVPIVFQLGESEEGFKKASYPKDFKPVQVLMASEQYGEAIKLLSPLIERDPQNIDLLAAMALCYFKLGFKVKSYSLYRSVYDLGKVFGYSRVNTRMRIVNILDKQFESE